MVETASLTVLREEHACLTVIKEALEASLATGEASLVDVRAELALSIAAHKDALARAETAEEKVDETTVKLNELTNLMEEESTRSKQHVQEAKERAKAELTAALAARAAAMEEANGWETAAKEREREIGKLPVPIFTISVFSKSLLIHLS